MIYRNYDGFAHAKELIAHGKVSHKPFVFTDEDERALLGPEGTDLGNHARHHLAVDDDQPYASPKRHRYPFAKDGQIYSRALHGIRNTAHDAGHEDVRDAANLLLGEIKARHAPDERAAAGESDRRHIVKDGGKYLLYTKDGHKLLSKHDTYEDALKQEQAIKASEAAAAKENNALILPGREVRSFFTEVRVKDSAEGPVIHGYGAVYERDSQPLSDEDGTTFIERIHPKAFEKLLASNPDVRGLANHDPGQLLGRTRSGTMTLRSDGNNGLHYEIRPVDSAIGDHYVKLIKRGDMDGSSFSFTVPPGGDQWDRTVSPPRRTVHEVRDLFDCGPVTFPAYLDATVGARSLRSLDAPPPRRDGDPQLQLRHHLQRQRARSIFLLNLRG